MAEAGRQTVREAVGVFHDRDSFQNTVEDLMSAGFDRAELSLLAGEQAVEGKLGHAYRRVQELEDAPTVPRAAYIGNHSLAEGRTGVIGGLASRNGRQWFRQGGWTPWYVRYEMVQESRRRRPVRRARNRRRRRGRSLDQVEDAD